MSPSRLVSVASAPSRVTSIAHCLQSCLQCAWRGQIRVREVLPTPSITATCHGDLSIVRQHVRTAHGMGKHGVFWWCMRRMHAMCDTSISILCVRILSRAHAANKQGGLPDAPTADLCYANGICTQPTTSSLRRRTTQSLSCSPLRNCCLCLCKFCLKPDPSVRYHHTRHHKRPV